MNNYEKDYEDAVPVSELAKENYKKFRDFLIEHNIKIYDAYSNVDGSIVVELKHLNESQTTQFWEFFANGDSGLMVVKETKTYIDVNNADRKSWEKLLTFY